MTHAGAVMSGKRKAQRAAAVDLPRDFLRAALAPGRAPTSQGAQARGSAVAVKCMLARLSSGAGTAFD